MTCVETYKEEEGVSLQGFLASGLRIQSEGLGIELPGTLRGKTSHSG